MRAAFWTAAAALMMSAPAAAQVFETNGDGSYRRSASLGEAMGYRQTSYLFRSAPVYEGPTYVTGAVWRTVESTTTITPYGVFETIHDRARPWYEPFPLY